jgi:cytochrome P450
MEGREHTRQRKLISAGFTPRMIGRLEDLIRTRTVQIIGDAVERGDIDFVADIAYQLPMHVIGDIVGIPESDRPSVFRLTDLMLRSADPTQQVSDEEREEAEIGLFTYAQELSASKRANPTDDVWSILANSEMDGFELDLFFMVLTFAGSETVRNALTQGVIALMDHPDQLADLRNDPSLIPTATEEILRWSSPAICFGRTVTRDVELGGQQLRAGDRVGLFYTSANRDATVFEDPQRFDIRRSPNPHVAFGGGGPHYCLGASLARTELQVMLGELLSLDTFEITGPPTWMSAGPAAPVGVAINALPARLG